MSDGSWRQVFKEISPQFLSGVHIAAEGAEPLEELHEVNVSTAILVENICDILWAKIFDRGIHDQIKWPFIIIIISTMTCDSPNQGVISELWKRKKFLQAQLSRAIRV